MENGTRLSMKQVNMKWSMCNSQNLFSEAPEISPMYGEDGDAVFISSPFYLYQAS